MSWHWVFFINLPIGVATLLLGRVLIEDHEGIGLRQGVDVLGSILVTAALMLGVYSIVTSAEYGCPCQARPDAFTSPRFPTPVPP